MCVCVSAEAPALSQQRDHARASQPRKRPFVIRDEAKCRSISALYALASRPGYYSEERRTFLRTAGRREERSEAKNLVREPPFRFRRCYPVAPKSRRIYIRRTYYLRYVSSRAIRHVAQTRPKIARAVRYKKLLRFYFYLKVCARSHEISIGTLLFSQLFHLLLRRASV